MSLSREELIKGIIEVQSKFYQRNFKRSTPVLSDNMLKVFRTRATLIVDYLSTIETEELPKAVMEAVRKMSQ